MKLPFKIFLLYLLQFLLVNSFDISKEILFESLTSPTDPREIGEYFSKFAAFSYCSPQRLNEHKCCYLDEDGEKKGLPNTKGETLGDWTLVEHDTSHQTNFKDEQNIFSVFRSDKYKKTVISFSGTQDSKQLKNEEILSAKCNSMDCRDDTKKGVCMGNYFKERMDAVFPLI